MLTSKVLLIEDDPDAVHLLTRYLHNIGYGKDDIIICRSYNDVTCLDRSGIGIVITDLHLPDSTDGNTFQKVKDLFPFTPVIVVTGQSQEDSAIKFIEQGAEDYLVKGRIDQHVLERSLRYAKARHRSAGDYRGLFEKNPAPMMIFDAATYRFLAVNTATLHQYGYSREEFLALTADRIRPEEERGLFIKASMSISDEYHNFGRWRHQKKSGEIFFVSVFAHAIEFEGKDARLVMAIDVDKQVKAEQAVKQKAKEIENILESITDGFFAVNKEGRITYVNSTFEKIIQMNKTEVLGQFLWTIFPETSTLTRDPRYQQLDSSIHFDHFYAPLERWLSVSIYPSDEGFTVFFIDITEQHRRIEMIEEQNERLKKINWIQSHEMRRPVANILGLAALFNRSVADTENLPIIGHIETSARLLDEMIRKITDYTNDLPGEE
jgi:PAS domain S-box-containing protein